MNSLKHNFRVPVRLQVMMTLIVVGVTFGPAGTACLARAAAHDKVAAFDLDQVTLLGGPERTAMKADAAYLHALSSDRLLYNFRKNAGLPSPGQPLGGWEAPDCELRGHFVGHYLSACALLYKSTGDFAIKAKAEGMVHELAKCQKALHQGGYLSAFPSSFFDRVETTGRVWAPYYTIHKIMAGLVDIYQLCGDKEALEVAEGMAVYFERRSSKLTDQQFDRMLRTEFGGMANTLYDLYAIDHRPADLALAHRFDQRSFLDPLVAKHDDLSHIHANTHIPKILGAARRYELMDDAGYRTAVAYFWDRIVDHRSYATGGSNVGEYWGDPDQLADTLAPNDQETCTTYNMLKVTRDLICWTADPRYADFYERAYFNGILPAQNPRDGMMIYFLPLAAKSMKQWGSPNDSFWCCYGTGVESFAKLQDSVYFHDASSVYVNLYVPSELTWQAKGLRLTQTTRFPDEQGSTFVVHAAHPTALTLRLHIPCWADRGVTVSVNDKVLPVRATPTSYLPISRVWHDGDRVHISLPMHLHTSPMPDDFDEHAVMYGPLVLAGIPAQATAARTVADDTPELVSKGAVLLPVKASAVDQWLRPVHGQPAIFETANLAQHLKFVPLYKVIDQPFTVYWIMTPASSPRYRGILTVAQAKQQVEAEYAGRIVDSVVPNNRELEWQHGLSRSNSQSGEYKGAGYRDGTGYFQWDLKVLPNEPMALACTFWGDDTGRSFDIIANGQKIATQTLDASKPGVFFRVEYPLPPSVTANAQNKVTVRFEARDGKIAGGVYGCATVRKGLAHG